MEQNVCSACVLEENIPNYAKCMKIKTDLCVYLYTKEKDLLCGICIRM